MMKERGLPRSLRLMFSGGVAVGLGLLAHSVQAQETKTDDAPQQMQRVEITGSSIKRVANEGVSPITIIKADDFAKAGITTASEALGSIAANQSQFTTSTNVGKGGTVGASADLRSLGSNKTLVLLNGRRLANSAFDGSTVDLNIIPIAALDRVEVLRDGASAIYGTDAIGGVINFITKRSYTGLNVSGEGIVPSKSGGQEGRINVSGGIGDLDKDGYNFFGVVDYHKQSRITAGQRGITGNVPSLGLSQTSGNTFPANFVDTGNGVSGNPLLATGCNAAHLAPNAKGTSCRYDYSSTIDVVPETSELAVIGKGTFKLNADNNASIEYLHSESKVKQTVAGDVFSGNGSDYLLPSSSKYYPGNGTTPAVAGLSGDPLSVNFRSAGFGGRVSEAKNTADRLLLSLDGTMWGWDYKTGLSYAVSKAQETLVSGYLNNDAVRAALLNGTLNPFGASDPGVYDAIKNTGKYLDAKTTISSLDFTASREIAQLPAGPLGFAIGGEYRHETAEYDIIHSVADLSESTGSSTSQSQSGKRNVGAVFSELSIPIVKNLEAQLAVRYDDYSDVGSTINPKIGLRWQPAQNLMFRSSYSTGFRAPSLYELNQPASTTFTSGSYNDPKLCPGGNVAAGGVEVRDCNTQFFTQTGGNKSLQPEKSTSFTLGTVFEPIKDVTVSIDYWNIKIKNQIGVISEADIFADPNKYANLYIRKPDGSLDYIVQTNQNLGNVHTQGFDLGLGWRLPKTRVGDFAFSIDGTYVTQYDYQSEKGGPYLNNLAVYAGGVGSTPGVVFRWRHNATLNWKNGPWGAMFQQTFSTGYVDANNAVSAPYDTHNVGSYTRYNTSLTYTGIKNLTLTGGIKNILDKKPPASNQVDNFQIGYDPRYGDIVGRAFFVRANYQFF
ncbi:TonB-dependent receptor [Collimonas sp. H4R21]|jgi:iron complex outermembrane receptor protein|uniref:TonB-dependent receptor n=1 Tax=Collimonas rhizosphaerae TaxID=3126357 RepID=A0ABU9Q2N0_9BURK